MSTAARRRELLKDLYAEASKCVRCPLHQTRTNVVFGAGNADAELMFVGEAPGANEDRLGLPFVGAAGKLLDGLLSEIGMERGDVFIANTLKCLRYTAQVQLGDGSWERIGRLVGSRYAGDVMSVDADGYLVRRPVTGWYATPLAGRRVYRLTYQSCTDNGAARGGIQLTGDHPVLTERGYVPVETLRSGDRVATGQGLSQLARDVVCGTVLGEGCLRGASAHLTFGHSARQAAYARYKAWLLSELRPDIQQLETAAVAGGHRSDPVVQVRTLAHRALGILRDEFYRPKKVVPEWLGDGLNSRMLAIWFMDSGYNRIREGGRHSLAEITAVAFSDSDLQTLITGLGRLGLPAKASRGRLYFDVSATERLSETVAPYVPPSMRHKLHPAVEARVPFDPSRLERGPTPVLYDEVDIEDLTDQERRDTTFFCIDVAETHNFVTAGGVVHNCRPPDNRDPHPLEIESCQGYLHRQIELVEPTMICTLGNFSTKLLRGDITGISRLHGREEVRIIGPRAVRLYPLYHPAAALYTGSTLEALRADFHRIPELLALGVPPQPEPLPELPEIEPEPAVLESAKSTGPEPAPQLGLF